MERTIRVTGKGKLSVKPDRTRITLTLEGVFPLYEETLRASAEDTETLRSTLTALDFEPSDLKTLSFNVDAEYESYEDERHNYKQRFVGYKYIHTMKLEFDSDNERLGKVLFKLANASVSPQFRISYTVGDPEKAKNELLARAVDDAKAKAEILAGAAGVHLDSILTVDYSMADIVFESHPVRAMAFRKSANGAVEESYDMAIEPDNIEVSDTVTVIWSIE